MSKPSNPRRYFTLVVLSLLLTFGVTATSETVRVCKLDCEYGSIAAALSDSDPGDHIRVQNGNYRGNLRIDKEVTISGTSSRWVKIIPARGDRPTVRVGPSAVSVTLKNLTVSSGEEAGEPGISVTGGGNLDLVEGLISGSGRGLLARDSATVELKEAEIRETRKGVSARNASEVVVHGGLVSGAGSGLSATNSSELTVIGTEVSDCRRTGLLGEDTGKINVLSSTIADNEGAGIKLRDFSRLNMKESQVKGNDGGGLLLNDSANAELTENELTYNGGKNLAIISKECGFSGPIEGFYGELRGTGNEITPAGSESLCPERFKRISTGEGGGYSYPFKPSTYAFVGLVGAASLVFLVSRL